MKITFMNFYLNYYFCLYFIVCLLSEIFMNLKETALKERNNIITVNIDGDILLLNIKTKMIICDYFIVKFSYCIMHKQLFILYLLL